MNPSQAIIDAEDTFAALADIPGSDAEMVKGRKCPECGNKTHMHNWIEEGMYFAEIFCNGGCGWYEEL